MLLSEKLRQIMGERGLTQADLCRLTGIATSLMSELVTGKRKRVSSDTLTRLSDGLGVPVQEFIAGEREGDRGYIMLIRRLEAEGVTPERLQELVEWVRKIKNPGD